MKEQQLHCIICPLGCLGTVVWENGEVKECTGFTCPRGTQYAREEVTAPKRMLTTTVRVKSGVLPLLPVISKAPLPKDKILSCARILAASIATAPIREGDIIERNILNLGVDIVAARDIETSNH